ncbi:hypothetical protein T484DRAFT_1757372 [Baffinella frigidus]|nr:hypothetical protein T484DRAFT_1757372 [Cryptophyta sp. CCMP2293]
MSIRERGGPRSERGTSRPSSEAQSTTSSEADEIRRDKHRQDKDGWSWLNKQVSTTPFTAVMVCWRTFEARQTAKHKSIRVKSRDVLTSKEKSKFMRCSLSGHSLGKCWKKKKEQCNCDQVAPFPSTDHVDHDATEQRRFAWARKASKISPQTSRHSRRDERRRIL